MANDAEEFEPYRKLKRGAQAVADFVGKGSSKLSPNATPAKPTPSSPAPEIGVRDVADIARGDEEAVRNRAERAQSKSDASFRSEHGPIAPIERDNMKPIAMRKARKITRKLSR